MIALAVAGLAFTIAPGRLADRLRDWSEQADVQLLFDESDVRGLGTLGFKCSDCSPYEALDGIIDGQAFRWAIHRDTKTGAVTVAVRAIEEEFQP